jgi:hypothetical protein
VWFNKKPTRPTAQDAANRLLVLKHLILTGHAGPPREVVDALLKNLPAEKHAEFIAGADRKRDELCQRLQREGLWKHASPREHEYFQANIFDRTHQQHVNASWRLEAAQTLMWALGLVDRLPPYDTQADGELLKKLPHDDPATFVRAARLRDRTQLDGARDAAELWHWRSRTRQLIERGEALPSDENLRAAGIRSFDDIVRRAAQAAAESGLFRACIDGDFPVRGVAYRDLGTEEWSEVQSISMERHFALNWLCGYAPGNRWDETPTDT